MKRINLILGLSLLTSVALAADDTPPRPLKALLITGGCCHDYTTQKQLIKQGLEERAHIDVTVVQQGGTTTNTKIPLYEDPNWADGWNGSAWSPESSKLSAWAASSSRTNSSTSGGALAARDCHKPQCLRIASITSG